MVWVTIMTDKINFGKGLGLIGGLNAPQKSATSKPGAGKTPADRVDFSSVLQEVNKAREAQAPVGGERAEKLAALQAQIAEGSYQPDLEKVAASLIDFFAGEKK